MTTGGAGAARRRAGAAVRRLRREVQWARSGTTRLGTRPEDGFDHEVARHATPLRRRLAGVDPALEDGKVTNLGLAVAHLDGVVLGPGARFSFWRQVGPPSSRRGFVPGLVLDHGRLTAGVGGGMCQLTNLLYWLTLHTPLTVVERWRHSYDVFPDASRTQPFGSGATCAWPSLDLQVVNGTSAAFRLSVAVGRDDLVGSWWADVAQPQRYEVYESAHVITNDAPGVFTRHNELRRRTVGPDGEPWADEPVATNHALLRYRPFLGPGSG